MRNKITLILILSIIFSCNRSSTPIVEEVIKTPEPETKDVVITFTAEEEEYIKKIQSEGMLKVAAYISPGSFEVDSNGRYSGFQYDLLMELSSFLNVDIDIETVLFSDIFSLGGSIPEKVKSNPKYSYTPDIFNRVDICAGFITVLPWRMQIMDMISYFPVRQMLISRGDNVIEEFGDLTAKVIGYGAGTSYERTLLRLKNRVGDTFFSKAYDFEENLLLKVSEGAIDGTIIDLQYLLLSLKNYPNLVAELPASDYEQVSWALERGDHLLSSIIQKFFTYAHQEEVIKRLFRRYYNFDLDNYYSLLEYDGVELYKMELSQDELDWIHQKKLSGGLKIATISNRDVYWIEDDGSITGFDYNMLEDLSQILGLNLHIEVQDNLTNFFSKDGEFLQDVTTDPSISYTPDLLNTVDLYLGPFSIVPWRKKLMRMIPMMPMGQVLANREGDEVNNLTDLNGKRVAVFPGSYQETLLNNLMDEEDFQVEFVNMKTDEDPLEFVKAGKADYLVDGAVYMAQGMSNLDGMSISPVKIDLVTVGWAVHKDDDVFASLLEKYFSKSLLSGSFAREWEESSGVNLENYLKIIKE